MTSTAAMMRNIRILEAGPVSELTFMPFVNRVAHIRKLSREYYIHLPMEAPVEQFVMEQSRKMSAEDHLLMVLSGRDPEKETIKSQDILDFCEKHAPDCLHRFKHRQKRIVDVCSVRRTLRELRSIINANVVDYEKCRWITLTYAQPDGQPMTDDKKLMNDVENCVAKARRKYGHFEYINVVEPQGSGAWHCHMIAIFPDKAPYMDGYEFAGECWTSNSRVRGAEKTSLGFVNIKALDNDADDLGAYLTAYLCDVEFNEETMNNPHFLQDKRFNDCPIEEMVIDGKKKQIMKGGRLHFYPAGMRIYRCSRGIKKPKAEWIDEEQYARKLAGQRVISYQNYCIAPRSYDDWSFNIVKMWFNKNKPWGKKGVDVNELNSLPVRQPDSVVRKYLHKDIRSFLMKRDFASFAAFKEYADAHHPEWAELLSIEYYQRRISRYISSHRHASGVETTAEGVAIKGASKVSLRETLEMAVEGTREIPIWRDCPSQEIENAFNTFRRMVADSGFANNVHRFDKNDQWDDFRSALVLSYKYRKNDFALLQRFLDWCKENGEKPGEMYEKYSAGVEQRSWKPVSAVFDENMFPMSQDLLTERQEDLGEAVYAVKERKVGDTIERNLVPLENMFTKDDIDDEDFWF